MGEVIRTVWVLDHPIAGTGRPAPSRGAERPDQRAVSCISIIGAFG
jgi:hypothetical protein